MAANIKVKFRISLPAEKEFKIVDKDLWEKSKNDFVVAANDEDGQQILANDYIELYGLSPVDNSYFEDDPNREVESIEQIIDETGKSI
jgi:hypothetical protein